MNIIDLFQLGSIWNRTNRNGQNKFNAQVHSILSSFDGTRLLVEGYNKFNKDAAGNGSINSLTGAVNNDSFYNTGFIEVTPGTPFTVVPSTGTGAYYDKDYQYLDKATTGEVVSHGTVIIPPAGARYYRGTVGTSSLNSFMIYEGRDVKPYAPYELKPSPLLFDKSFLDEIQEQREYFDSVNELTLNRGNIFPLMEVELFDRWDISPTKDIVKNIILDAKVEGAKPGCYYRVSYIANGQIHNEKPRYGMTVEERDMVTRRVNRFVFVWNDSTTPANQKNYNATKASDGIDTVIADGGDIVVSVTIDRSLIPGTTFNMNQSGSNYEALNTIIHPNKYSF